MGYFDSQFITDAGSALLAKATAETGDIIFTTLHIGDGEYSLQDISKITSCTSLKRERQIFPVNNIDFRDKDARVHAVITNHDLAEGYYIKEAGLYARMGDMEEILFSTAICAEHPTFLPAMGDVPIEMPVINHITYSGDERFTIEYKSDVYASLDMVEKISEKTDDNKREIDNLQEEKADRSDLIGHLNNSAIHFTASERTKLAGIATAANKYTHPVSAAGAKASGLYKIATDVTGHVTGAAAVTKADITGLGIPGANTTYSTGTASTAGLTKLYTATGTGTDGTMTRSAITSALNGKATTGHTHRGFFTTITGTNSNSVFTFMKENITTSTSASLFVLIVVKLGAHILLGAMTYAGGYHFYTIYKDSNYINAELNASNNITVSGPAGKYTFFSIVLSS